MNAKPRTSKKLSVCLTEPPQVTVPLVEENERLAEGFVVADDY